LTCTRRPQAQPVFFGPLHFSLPQGLATGISGTQVPRADSPDLPAFQWTPGHTQVKLGGYLLQGKSQEPQIYVYPAQGYAELAPAAFEAMHRLQNITGNPGAPIDPKLLPAIPFFNTKQVLAAHIQPIPFKNGQGVRFISEYAQYPASANNTDLFYNFQGLTQDGGYYIIAILPITHPKLAETSDGGAVLPPGGIPYYYFSDPKADMMLYYKSVVELLNSAAENEFSPSIIQLDDLIQSIQMEQ
jgi:hypothetical protein